MGRESARPPMPRRTLPHPCRGGHIRTLNVSLLAVATVVTGILISRIRLPRPIADAVKRPRPERPTISLDALREAGL
jgi:hypothetical protein